MYRTRNETVQNPNHDQENNIPDTAHGTTPDKNIVMSKKTVLVDITYNVAAAICYVPVLLNLVAPIAWLYSEPKDNRFVRYHAAQGLVLLAAYLVVIVVINTIASVLSFIPMIGPMLGLVASLFGAVVFLAYVGICFRVGFDTFKGKPGKLPIIKDYIENTMDQYNV